MRTKSIKIIFCAIVLVLMFFSIRPAFAADAPILLFSDLTDGAISGGHWGGAQEGKGAAVSIWGRNFGSTRGSGYVSVGGVNLTNNSDYAEWGATTNPQTANGQQRITFWLNSNMQTGAGTIKITTANGESNTIPFYCRNAGNIYFVSTSGNDSNNGLYPASQGGLNGPKQTGGWVRRNLHAGDTVYFRTGTYTQEDPETFFPGSIFTFIVDNHNNGVENNSIGVTSYPGELVQLGVAKNLSHAFAAKQTLTNGFVTIENQPAVPMKISLAVVDPNEASYVYYLIRGSIVISGLVGGTQATETLPINGGGSYETANVFSSITSIETKDLVYKDSSGNIGSNLDGDETISAGYKGTTHVFRKTGTTGSLLNYWTFSKFKMEAWSTVWDEGQASGEGSTGVRIIGNDGSTSMTNAFGEGVIYAMAGGGQGMENRRIYGNYLHDPQSDYRGELTNRRIYCIYIGGYGSLDNIDIGWNEMGWDSSGRGFQIYGHTCADTLDNLYLHDNYIHHSSRQNAIIGSGEGCGTNYNFVKNAYIYNNIFAYPGAEDVTLQLGGGYGSGRYGGNYYVYNNVFFLKNAYPVLAVGHDLNSFRLVNNIISGVSNSWNYYSYFPDSSAPTDSIGNNNLYYGAGAGHIPSWDSSTLDNTNPQFANSNPQTFSDFKLLQSSAAINAGSSNVSSIVSKDFMGISRPQGTGYDIGAYEYDEGTVSDTTAPGAPGGLSVR